MTKIELFTSSNCPKCRALKERLKKMEIEFEEKNTDNHEERLYMYMVGRCTVPTLVVDGRVVDDVDGFLRGKEK